MPCCSRILLACSALFVASVSYLTPAACAQQPVGPQLILPQASPRALVVQAIGLTDVTVEYHTPAVKGRPIWGGLVPYDQVWRAGANENTLLTFSQPVKLNGKSVPAGQYSLYLFPRQQGAWDWILNRVTTHWGSENYDPQQDLAHVPTLPDAAPFHENLLYWFSDLKSGTGRLNLTWEKQTLSLLIETDVQQQVVAGIDQTLKAQPDSWQLLAQAADYLVQNNLQPELALRYVNESLRLNDGYANNWIKARLLASQQDYGTALVYARKALKLGSKEDDTFKNQQAAMRLALVEWQAKAY